MARFIRDEKRTYPFMWLAIGGLFAGSAAWATYAELVTRVPWEKEQQAFFDMEFEQSKQSLSRAKQQWDAEIAPGLKDQLARKEELEKSQATGEYAKAKARLAQLNKDFADAELGKTFGSSDLDEAYYYRNIAGYARDRAANKVREAYHIAWAADAPAKVAQTVDAIYADPPEPPLLKDEGDKQYRLRTEIARMQAHVAQIDRAMTSAPDEAKLFLTRSRAAEQEVVDRLQVEVKHQKRVDDALVAMARIEGPADPVVSEKEPAKRAAQRTQLRNAECQSHEDTRSCLLWQKLEPVDNELKTIDVEIAKRRRTLTDAELRESKATSRAKPPVNLGDMIHTLVGPYQIQQTVLHWIDQDRDVDTEQVDRCQTCHMGEDSAAYTSPSIPKQFRTHPHRSTLIASHPIEKFGCTSCHQGQGRATDMLSHSTWHLEERHGRERWHYAGDHYWDDPLLTVGELTRVIIDSSNDEFEVKVHKGKWEKVKIAHKNPREHDRTDDLGENQVGEDYKEESEFLGDIQESVGKLVNEDLAKKWHAVVRKVDNRIQIGLEQNDLSEHVAAKDVPGFGVKFAKPELAHILGFAADAEIVGKSPTVTATTPPMEPVRSEGMAQTDATGRYHPPRGDEGLQIPDGMRNRFIEGIPELEAGCQKCHTGDVDLRPRASDAKYVAAKLEFEKAQAWLTHDAAGYKKEHDGQADLPPVPPDPATLQNPVPTLAEGRALFRKLNCTGCHILDGFGWDRNSGPSLDNITAKVTPDFILTWIRNPRGWREKTRMPNLWPKPLDPGSKRPFASGSPEYNHWEAQMREETVAIASFLVEHSDKPSTRGEAKDTKPLKTAVAGYAKVDGASIEKGKLVFESYGCQGCHARSDHDDAHEKLPEAWKNRERDVAPTLANMGAKTTADWVAYWVEAPNRYWHGTKMPNLRLSRVEAASVGLYVASLKSAPLNAANVDKGDIALVSDPATRNARVPCSNAGGALMTRVECGEKLIGYYGCFGCHQISGYDKSAPVAPELGGFAKKDVTTLDFGYAIADHHLQTTETFATLKLDSPRIYRRDRIELKMADFDLSPREIRSLVVFLKSLVSSKPKEAYDTGKHADYAAALEGRQLVDDYNCRACHMIEGHGADIDGFRANQIGADPQARAPFLTAEGQRVQPEWLFSFLRDPGAHGIRPWLHPEWIHGEGKVPDDKLALRMPTFNFTPEQVTAIVRYFASWDGQEYPYQAASVKARGPDEKLYALAHMNSGEAANCLSCHYQSESATPTVAELFDPAHGRTDIGKLAPNFNEVARRLRPEWVKAWLLKPQNFLPYTKMTAFWATKDRPKTEELWPSESDPFLSGALAWNKAPGPKDITAEQQVEMVRDFLFSLPKNAKFPAQGAEATSPLVTGLQTAAAEPAPAADEPADKDGGDKKKDDKKKGGDKKKGKKRQTGQGPVPAHL